MTAEGGDDQLGSLRAEVEALQKRLDEAQRGTHAFVAMLAHELRTPLGAILMWAHVLRMGRESDREVALDAIETSARAQSKLIGSLLDVTRAAAGRLRIEKLPVDLGGILQAAAEECEGLAGEANVRLQVVVGPGPLQVLGDPVRLREMVSTLLVNGIGASPAEGVVRIEVARRAEMVRLSVRDGRTGASGDELNDLFTPFRMADDTEPPRPGTLGLELPLLRLLVDLHGGTVVAQPAPAGSGPSSCWKFLPGRQPKIQVATSPCNAARRISSPVE